MTHFFTLRNEKRLPLTPAENFIAENLARRGKTPVIVKPAAFTFVTAMRIASAARKSMPAAIIAHTTPQLIAAVSSLKIIKAPRQIKIIFRPDANAGALFSIAREIAGNISAIIYHSHAQQIELQHIFPKESIVDTPVHFLPTPAMSSPDAHDEKNIDTGNITLRWSDGIGDGKRLSAILKAICALPRELKERINIEVDGHGRARYVMPIVRYTRNHPEINILWPESDGPAPRPGKDAIANIATSSYINYLQASNLSDGIPVIESADPAEIAALVTSWLSSPDTFRKASGDARRRYNNDHNPCFHVEQFLSLL